MKILLFCTRLRVSMFIVLVLCQESSNELLRVLPSQVGEEFVIKEGEGLYIEYSSDTRLKFIFPYAYGKLINTSNYNVQYFMKNDIYYYNFERPNTIFTDTGWYGCTNHNFNSSTFTKSSDIKMDRFYVYVKSDTNLFVEVDTNVHLSAAFGGSIVIPCRTTLPDLKPILINGKKDELKASYDPKIGFTIRNLSLEDSNWYKCLIEKNGEKHSVSYKLSVLKQTLLEPKIQINDLFITHGEDLYMNCTAEMKLPVEYEFGWNLTQQNDNRRSIQQFKKQLEGNTVLVTSQLIIFNVTDEDAGDYACIIRSSHNVKKTTKNIRIYDPQTKLIKLIPTFNTSYIGKKSGSGIPLTVLIMTSFDTDTQWFKPNGEKIVGNSNDIIILEHYSTKNSITKVFKTSTLEISLLNITDSGVYTFQAKHDYAIEKMNFILDVIDKPISILMPIDSYYLPTESTEFRCEVTSNPSPNITWNFLKCPNYPSLENSTIVHIMNVTQSTAYNSSYKFVSIAKMRIEISGKITCEACNDFGCDSKTENINVSVPVPPFFVTTNMNKTKTKIIDVTAEGQNTVILQCIADGIPKPIVTWYKDNMLLKKNNQYLFKYNNQELHIKYLMLHDTGKYSCQANNSMGINETYQQIIVRNAKWRTLDTILVTSIPILSFILIILAIFLAIKIRRQKKMRKELMEVGLINFEEGAPEIINPNLTVDEQAELLPYDKKWEFPIERLKMKEQLGSGHFGVVMKAEAIGICENEYVTTVAVKKNLRTINLNNIRALTSELKIMVHLGKHLNVVNLLGACTKNISKCELLVIVEYCHFGNLHNYLLRHRNYFINQIDSKIGKLDLTMSMDVLTRTFNVNNDSKLNANSDTDMIHCTRTNSNSSEVNFLSDCVLSSNSFQPGTSNYCDDFKNGNFKLICTQDLLSWSFQVARGMEYLSQRKVLHGDLAARNILLAEGNIVKICDFGLAKNIYKDNNYKKKSDVPMPVKWMAIESIRDRVFSTQSDVWSFGVMFWEFFTLAKTPYPDMEVDEQYQKLIEGYRLEKPDYATHEIYDIMLQCWIAKPTLRPSFTDLVESIGNLLEENVRMHYISLNNSNMDINTMNMKNGKSDYLIMMCAPDYVVPSFLDNKCVNTPLSKDTSGIRPDYPIDDSGIFNRPNQDQSHIPLPMSSFEHAIELSLTPKHEEELYLKPINVHERRTEFVRQRQAMKNQMVKRLVDQNSVYCNASRNLLNKVE